MLSYGVLHSTCSSCQPLLAGEVVIDLLDELLLLAGEYSVQQGGCSAGLRMTFVELIMKSRRHKSSEGSSFMVDGTVEINCVGDVNLSGVGQCC